MDLDAARCQVTLSTTPDTPPPASQQANTFYRLPSSQETLKCHADEMDHPGALLSPHQSVFRPQSLRREVISRHVVLKDFTY